MYAGDVFHVFDLMALERRDSEEPLAQPEVTAMIEKGNNKFTVIAEEYNGEYIALFQFPEAGNWKLTVYVERPVSSQHDDQHDDQAQLHDEHDGASFEEHDTEDTTYYETKIKVKHGIEKIAPFWVLGAGLLLILGLFLTFFIRKVNKRNL